MTDQGFAWGQHGCREKWMAYDANIAAPLIISWSRSIQPGGVCDEPVTGLDIVALFHSLTGIAPVRELHGRDMSPLLQDPAGTLSEPLLMTHTARVYGTAFQQQIRAGQFVGQKPKPAWLMLRDGRYKYIRHMQKDTLEELYDLVNDPHELTNLAVLPEHRARLRALRRRAVIETRQKDGPFVDHLPSPRDQS